MREHLKNEVIGYNLETGTTAPINSSELPLTNSMIGQIEALGVLINMDYNTVKSFYINQRIEEEEENE